ncbi:mitochondrial outer membrane protein porin 5-like [Curcuma longa]|uniref:mitochondrial outer membrane protein porin 5-like n=1 Tax=Curcuma longa TaxID=136217 RepID=UPI003D9DC8FC
MTGPGLFSDIGKKAKDLLTKDYYTYDQKLSVSSSSVSGVALTSAAVRKGGLCTFDVGSQYKYKNTLIDAKVDTESNISATLIISDILPSTKAIASIKLPDYNSGKLEVQYLHHHASLASVVTLNKSPLIELSGTIGAQGIAFGSEVGYDTSSGVLTKYNAGIDLTKPEYNASVILMDKGDTLKASLVRHLDETQRNTGVLEILRRFSINENTVTVGAQYALDPQTIVKARLNNFGKLGALLQHEVIPKSILTISGELDTKALERTPKFGLALALKP